MREMFPWANELGGWVSYRLGLSEGDDAKRSTKKKVRDVHDRDVCSWDLLDSPFRDAYDL